MTSGGSDTSLLSTADRHSLIFLGGKGGTGKTTLAAAIARAASQRGRKTLLVSTDPAHNLGHLFGRTIGAQAVELADNFDAVELDPDQTVDDHLTETRGFLRQLMPPRLHGEIDKHLQQGRDAPGMLEAALLESIAITIEKASEQYELIVFDTAPSGHTARLMALPEMLGAWTEGLLANRQRSERLSGAARILGARGETNREEERDQRIRAVLYRRRKRFADLRQALTDRGRTAFFIVLTAERLPVMETIELYAQLEALGVPVPGVIVNKRTPEGQGEFLEARRGQEDLHLTRLVESLPNVVIHEVALRVNEPVGLEGVDEILNDWGP